MNTKRKEKISYKIKILISAIIFFAAFLIFCKVKADSITDISNGNTLSDKEKQEQIDDINSQMETIRQIREIKEKQADTLINQLAIADSNIQQVQAQIDMSYQQIENLNSQIIRIQEQIKEKMTLIESQRKLLGQIIQTYYETNNMNPVVVYLSGENIASFMVNKDRIAQTGDKIKELVDSIMEIKKNLEEQSAEFDQKKNEFVNKNQELQNQNDRIALIKQQKQTLLIKTQGEETRYQQLLQNLEKQKQQLLDVDQYFAASGLSTDSYAKPDSKYFASTGWYYSQRDSRWGNDNIGNTRTLIKSYGCALTAVAMVFKEHGISMDPGILANKSIFSGDLINWYDSKDWEKNWLVPDSHGYSHGNISWSVVDSKIKSGIPVIVYIKKSNGGGGHYVVIHNKEGSNKGSEKGRYIVHDPYFGANIFLDTSRALIGAMGSKSSTLIDQMIIYN